MIIVKIYYKSDLYWIFIVFLYMGFFILIGISYWIKEEKKENMIYII